MVKLTHFLNESSSGDIKTLYYQEVKRLGDSIIDKFKSNDKKIERHLNALLLRNYNRKNVDTKKIDQKDKFYKDVYHYIDDTLSKR